MGLLDDTRELIRREKADENARAARERTPDPIIYFTFDDEAAELVQEFVRVMRRLRVKPQPLYQVVHQEERKSSDKMPKTTHTYTCWQILHGWTVHGYAITVDARMIGLDVSHTVQANHIDYSKRSSTRHSYKYRYIGFGRIRVGDQLTILKPYARSLRPDDTISASAWDDYSSPSYSFTLRQALVDRLANLIRR